MKKYAMILSLIAGLFLVSCDDWNNPESLEVKKPYTYSELYYQNLRDYKASDHSVAFGWFADYTQSHSMAIRFAGLPDSLDICSLWGGIPSDRQGVDGTFYDPFVCQEMRYVQKVKGTKMVVPTIVRMDDEQRYGNKEYYKLFQESYSPTYTGTEEERLELRQRAMRMYADELLKPIFEMDLDGIDLDFEPEGDRLEGENFVYFVKYIGQFVGPKSSNPSMLFVIDGWNPGPQVEPYINYYVSQNYNNMVSKYSIPDWCPSEKFITTENIGDFWKTGGYLLQHAAWQPETGRKGGFGAFYIHRDYNLYPPYKNFRAGIQLQNPAVK